MRAVSRAAPGVDHVVALAPVFHQFRDQLGRVLQIGVDHDDRIAPTVIEAGGQSDLLAEVAAQVDDRYSRVAVVERFEQLAGGVPAAVVGEDDLGGSGTCSSTADSLR